MPHEIYRVKSFEIVGPYTLRIGFDDSTTQTINFEAILNGELYRPLRDLSVFNQVKIDPEIETLVWPNGADFDPETLHNWPDYEPMLRERAKQWSNSVI